MAARSATEIPDVTLDRAGAGAVPVLRRLMQLYLYDLGTIDGWDIAPDGRFGNARSIERFWRERGRRSFFIHVGTPLAGFALIHDRAHFAGAGTREISEFFVLRKYRRRGVGRQAAVRLFDLFPGPWEIAELASNVGAQAFWREVIAGYTRGAFQDTERTDGDWRGRVQGFRAPGSGSR